MAPDEQQEQPVGPGLAAGPVQLVYMNWLRTAGTPNDLGVMVGYQSADFPPQPAAHLVMTWEVAVILRDALASAIRGFEENAEPVRDLSKYMQLGPAAPLGGEEQ